ncbi:MAG TPA: C40 family peptidase [Steroidobacteraceae bacterium]|nr:C40 family peptidase [Steroidobacteraceae bacterium]
MRRNFARGSRHRGRGVCHDGIRAAALKKAILAGLMALTLGACATTSHQVSPGREITPPIESMAGQKPSPTQLMIDSATSMIGQPYRFGGAAPGGFDCSGLVVYAAANAGIRVPRTAAEQLQFGAPVRRTELQAGDLVFMHLSSKELHVAIALDRQLFVHAPSSGGRVRVDSLLAQPYEKAFIAARRVVSFAAPH